MRIARITFLVFRVTAGLWVAAVTVFSALQQLGYLNPSPKLEPIAWTISLCVIGVESIGAIIRDKFESVAERRRGDLDRWALTFVLTQLADGHQQRGLKFEDLGLSVWVPTYRSRLACWLLRKGRDHHKFKRLNRFRPEGYPQQSPMTWTGKMGTLGDCWTAQQYRYHDNSRIANKFGNSPISDEQFEKKVSDSVKRGFSREQFTRIVGKYSEVLAVPVLHSDTSKGKMIGVVTIDRVHNPDENPFIAHLHDKATLRRAEAAAAGASATITGTRRD